MSWANGCFPGIALWLMQNSESALKKHYARQVPETVAGSYGPLLERALCEGRYPDHAERPDRFPAQE